MMTTTTDKANASVIAIRDKQVMSRPNVRDVAVIRNVVRLNK